MNYIITRDCAQPSPDERRAEWAHRYYAHGFHRREPVAPAGQLHPAPSGTAAPASQQAAGSPIAGRWPDGEPMPYKRPNAAFLARKIGNRQRATAFFRLLDEHAWHA